ncbi:MAG: hypothetical protein JO360_00370 [Acidobacteria bacterium]|nr:hypothetical protein [Acidobacteriota bacterium]
MKRRLGTAGLFPVADDKFFFASSVVTAPSPDVATWSFKRGQQGSKGGNRNITTKLFPKADHDLSVRLDDGRWAAPPDYHPTLVDWLSKLKLTKG